MATVEVPAGIDRDTAARVLSDIAAHKRVRERFQDVLAEGEKPVAPAVVAQLAATDRLWRRVIENYGVLTSGEIAVLRGSRQQDRSVATRLRKAGTLLRFRRGGRNYYPAWQFCDTGLDPEWESIALALIRDAGWREEDVILWMVSPNSRLDGREPASMIGDLALSDVVDLMVLGR